MKKKIIAVAIIATFALGNVTTYAGAKLGLFDGIKQATGRIFMNDKDITDTLDSNGNQTAIGITDNGQTFISLRAISENMKAEVYYNEQTKNVAIVKSLPNSYVSKNGEPNPDGSYSIVLPNGMFVEDVIKSNRDINQAVAYKISGMAGNDKEAIARKLYDYVKDIMTYDNNIQNYVGYDACGNPNGGAIKAFGTGNGICYDYATLYYVMAKQAGLNVRLVSGYVIDDGELVGHAWNEVLANDGKTWIAVDATFGDASDSMGWNFDEKNVREYNNYKHAYMPRFVSEILAQYESY